MTLERGSLASVVVLVLSLAACSSSGGGGVMSAAAAPGSEARHLKNRAGAAGELAQEGGRVVGCGVPDA